MDRFDGATLRWFAIEDISGDARANIYICADTSEINKRLYRAYTTEDFEKCI